MPSSPEAPDAAAAARPKSTPVRRFTIRLVTVLIALAFALMLAEIAVRVLAPQNLSGTWRKTDRFGMMVHQRNHSARHQLGDRVVQYRFDEDGLRDLGQGDGETKVLCLGDSFTFGWLLDDKDTYIANLQEKADDDFGQGRVTLLNGGHGGWGASDYVRFFEEYGGDHDVRGAIVFLNTDDIGRSLRKPKYDFTEEGKLVPRPEAGAKRDGLLKRLANAIPVYPWLLEHCHLLQLARNASVAAMSAGRQTTEEDAEQETPLLPQSSVEVEPTKARELGQALFKRLKKLADDQSVELLVLTTGFHHVSSPQEGEPTQAFMATAPEQFAADGIVFYDCTDDLMRKLGDDYSSIQIVGDGHPNEDGAELIAELNWQAVREFLTRLSDSKD